jgi:hypothetical protein
MKKLLAILVFGIVGSILAEESSMEKQLLEACSACDLDKDGKLTPSEIWYAKSISKGKNGVEAQKLVVQMMKKGYTPPAIDETKAYGPAKGKEIKLFILSGQSNMVGQGLSAEIPDNLLKPNDRILIFENGKWQPLRPLKYTFGPEVSFARMMAKKWPNETIGIVKQSVGGTGVLAWHPQWTKEKANLTGDGKKGNLWKALTDKVSDARNAADCEVMGFIWMQGGKDMKSKKTGKAYLQNLKALVEGLRKETGVKDLPFVLGSYRSEEVPDDLSGLDPASFDSPGRLGGAYVLKAQFDAQMEFPPTKMVPLRDVERHPENVHYNTAGQLKLGNLLADGYLELTGQGN